MSNSSSAPESTRRYKIEDKKPLLRELPASQFLRTFKGPEVVVSVQGEDFTLPKGLLSYNSPYFDCAFNGAFQEATEQKLSMSDCSRDTFKLVIQWIYTSKITLDEVAQNQGLFVPDNTAATQDARINPKIIKVEQMSQNVTRLLDFLMVADKIQLLGPFDSVVEMMKQIIVPDRSALLATHIRAATNLPSGHGARKLFGKACVKDYLEFLYKSQKMRFGVELEELDSFAADVLRETPKLWVTGRNYSSFRFQDPLTNEEITL
ncbi:hypothetical protein BDZ45DRAFT_685928 [Acephala macrosclerotiorum]|nr:hypothetical protein BDZ45DRAFT_685928 [Acephala macrosclerotiorum]